MSHLKKTMSVEAIEQKRLVFLSSGSILYM